MTSENDPTPTGAPARRRLPRGVQILILLVGIFVVLQGAEAIWRQFQPESARPTPVASTEPEPEVPPEVRIDGSRVVIEHRGSRTRIRFDDEDEAQPFVECIQSGIDDEFAQDPQSPTARLSRREAQRRIRQITDNCVARSAISPGS